MTTRLLRRITAALLVLAPALCASAHAAQHLMAIQEVFTGTPADSLDPNIGADQRAQYVMLRMTSNGQDLVLNTAIRIEDKDGNILGKFGTFKANVANGGSLGCVYPNCPAIVMGTQAAKNLFTFAFDQIVDGQAGRVALPVSGGRACFTNGSTTVFDCLAWGNFSCTPANCPSGANGFHAGDLNGNLCASSFGAPASSGGLQYGRTLARKTFSCTTKVNSTDFQLAFPRPVNNAGTNNNTDTDVDGLIDQLDCNRTNNTIQWAPIEVQGQSITGHASSNDNWNSEASFVGTGVRYDEVRGSLSKVAGFTDDACHASGLSTTTTPDNTVPVSGDGYYYLVRANGGAGCVGSYGKDTSNTARDSSLVSCP